MWKLYISCNYSALEGPFNLDIDFNNWAAVFSPFSYFTHQLIRVWSFFGHWWCSPCFIRLEILIDFVGNKKNCFFLLQILSRKPSFFFKKSDRLTWWVSLLSHNYSFASEAFLVIGDIHLALFALKSLWTLLEVYIHWRCLPCFIRYEILKNFVGRKQNCFFTKYLLLFCMFNF